ncbi:MAG TPA: Os1348 family NHLP clan protein [Micromonosporaceae bacterium]|jgi:hypothetical protein
MSDFDEVLERLVTDAAFQGALRADPEAALQGYQLDAEERRLLGAQVSLGEGADRSVEDRVSKSGLFGMVGPVVSALGLVQTPHVDVEPPQGVGVLHGATDDQAPVARLGEAPDDVRVALHGAASGEAVVGVAPHPSGAGEPATDYTTRVDAGQGRWEEYRAVERGDGGVDILVDRDGDGTVDWVGHDYNRDGLMDNADYDSDGDGIFDTRASDDDGDGWFDRTSPYPTGSHGEFGITDPGGS